MRGTFFLLLALAGALLVSLLLNMYLVSSADSVFK